MAERLFLWLIDRDAPRWQRLFAIEVFEVIREYSSGLNDGLAGFNQTRYGFSRYNFGSYFAVAAATWNLHIIRQKVIKYALYFTQSKRPQILYPVS